MADGAVPLVMSLSPFINRSIGTAEVGHLYQALCVDTWRANGFRVVSVNAAVEAPRVRALYPTVEVIESPRDLSERCGKPLIPLAEMLVVLNGLEGEFGGIVNSDVFVPPCDFAPWLDATLRGGPSGPDVDCLFMSRQEVPHPAANGGGVYKFGFDGFFFRKAAMAGIDWDPFAIGLPWWDYYLPMALLLKGRSLARVEGAPLRHLSHPLKWSQIHWQLMFEAFRKRLGEGIGAMHAAQGDAMPTLTALVHEDRMCTYLAERPVAREVDDPGFDAAQRYREGYSLSVVDLVYQLSGAVEYQSRQAAA